MGLTALGAGLLSGGLGFLGAAAEASYNAREAQKDRDFQEKMYHQQVEDNIKFWEKNNQYNLPSAQRQRIEDANLNPYLMYSGGSVANVATSAPQAATAPHGSKASANIGARLELGNLALMEAQRKDLEASAELKMAEAGESKERKFGQTIQNEINWRTRDAQVAMKNKDVEFVNQQIEWLATQDFALTNITSANLNNIASMIEFREKYYNMDFAKTENQIWTNIEQIAIGKQHVSNELQEIAVKLYDAKTQRMRVQGELKVFAEQVKEISSRVDLNSAQKDKAYLEAYNTFIKNSMLEDMGTDNLGGAAGLLLLLTGNLSGRIKD